MNKTAQKKAQIDQIASLADKGYTQKEMAEQLGVSTSTIKLRLRDIKQGIVSNAIVSNAITKSTEGDIDVISQLKELNTFVWNILNAAEDDNAKLNATKEIRSQLELQVKILDKIYDAECIQLFQKGVMQALDDTHPDLRREAIKRINALKEMEGVMLL